mmetsp:Transcript_42554/g.77280  ORF Transcript_42554/g.77280 Transcript_42554/m.77280 type:complete len:362 (-) Transcript_42554:55-1140(-)
MATSAKRVLSVLVLYQQCFLGAPLQRVKSEEQVQVDVGAESVASQPPLLHAYNSTVTTLNDWNLTALYDDDFNGTRMPWNPTLKRPRVLFNIITSPQARYEERLNATLDTWAGELDPSELQIVGRPPLAAHQLRWVPATSCVDNHQSGFACKEAHSLSAAVVADPDWLIILGEDNYVVTRNVKKVLARFNPNASLYFGVGGCGAGELCKDKMGGVCGGGGEILSRGALLEMMNGSTSHFLSEHAEVAANETAGWGDQATTCLARRHAVNLKPIGGIHPWATPLWKQELYNEVAPPLTFHYVTPSQMHEIHGAVQAYNADVEFNATHPQPQMSLLQTGSEETEEAFTMQYFQLFTPLIASLN